MYSQEIRDLGHQIANLSATVSPEVWMKLAPIKNNLLSIAEGIEGLETVPLALEELRTNIAKEQ